MRRQAIAVAAVACLATAACTTADPAETPAPTTVTTTTVPASESATTAAPSDETPKGPPPETDSEDAGTTGRDIDLADQSFAVTPPQAIATAQEKAGNGILHSIELDWSQYHDAWVYELDILNGTTDHEFDINADTGEILEHDTDDTDDQEQEVSLDSPMAWETARDKAQGAVQGRFTSWQLEWDDGHPTYEFDIEDSSGDEIEVEINADTGTVKIDD